MVGMTSGPVLVEDVAGVGTRLAVQRRLLLMAGVLAAVSVGLPWTVVRPAAAGMPGLQLAGTSHPVRVIALAAAVALWWAVHRASRTSALAALLVAATALPLGISAGLTSGRIVYAAAIAVAAVAIWRSPAPPDR
jgi:hypothetical protein